MYLVSLSSPTHSLPFTGTGLVHFLVLVVLHDELHVDGDDQVVHPPFSTHWGFLAGSVQAGTQSSSNSDFPGHCFPPLAGAGLLQYLT